MSSLTDRRCRPLTLPLPPPATAAAGPVQATFEAMAEEPLQVSSLWAFDADLAEKIEEQEHKVEGGKEVCCVAALLTSACAGASKSPPRPPA